MTDTTARDQLVKIMTSPRMYTNSGGDAQRIHADAIVAAGWRPPARVIETPEDLDALPDLSVVMVGLHPWQHRHPWWDGAGFSDESSSADLIEQAKADDNPITLLWTPGDH